MKCVLVFAALVAVASSAGLGAPSIVDANSSPISEHIIAKAKELGSASNVVITKLTENSSTMYTLWKADLTVDGKKCTITVSEQEPLKWLEGPSGCVLCC